MGMYTPSIFILKKFWEYYVKNIWGLTPKVDLVTNTCFWQWGKVAGFYREIL